MKVLRINIKPSVVSRFQGNHANDCKGMLYQYSRLCFKLFHFE